MTEKITIGNSAIPKEHLDALRDAWKKKRLVLFLGAGVSMEYGMLTWSDLVSNMLLEQRSERDEQWRRMQSAVLSWLSDNYGLNPVLLAQVVEAKVRKEEPNRSVGATTLLTMGLVGRIHPVAFCGGGQH